MFKPDLEKAEEQEINIHWIIEKARGFQKNIYFSFIDYAKSFDCVDHNKLWKILKEMGIPDHLICLLTNLYASQEATVITGHETTDWFQIGKGVYEGYILSTCLFNLYAESNPVPVQPLSHVRPFVTIGFSALASFLPKNTQDWSPLGWTGWISLQSKGVSRVFSNTTVQKHQFFGAQLCSQSNSHIHT